MTVVITNTSKKISALETEGMVLSVKKKKEKKKVGLYFVCTQFIFMRWEMRRLDANVSLY